VKSNEFQLGTYPGDGKILTSDGIGNAIGLSGRLWPYNPHWYSSCSFYSGVIEYNGVYLL